MREAKVLGSITSTIKHPCLYGKKLLIVQVLNAVGQPEGRPQIVVDFTGAGKGDRVLLSWDGIGSQDPGVGRYAAVPDGQAYSLFCWVDQP